MITLNCTTHCGRPIWIYHHQRRNSARSFLKTQHQPYLLLIKSTSGDCHFLWLQLSGNFLRVLPTSPICKGTSTESLLFSAEEPKTKVKLDQIVMIPSISTLLSPWPQRKDHFATAKEDDRWPWSRLSWDLSVKPLTFPLGMMILHAEHLFHDFACWLL